MSLNDGADIVDYGEKWYENDLQLAAELGKTLLERNRDLETQLHQSQQLQQEQLLEIDLLQKQIAVLRNVNESRMQLYEDIDHSLHEKEQENEALKKEKKADKDYIRSLHETIDQLQSHCENLQHTASEQRNGQKRQRGKRARSLTSLADERADHRGPHDYVRFASLTADVDLHDKRRLQESLKKLKLQLSIEQNKRKFLSNELATVVNENKALEVKLQSQVEVKDRTASETMTEIADFSKNEDLCSRCQRKMAHVDRSQSADSEFIEHDLFELPRGELIRLKNGGSAYGSRESLNLLGLEAEDSTPSLEVCSTILAADVMAKMTVDDDDDERGRRSKSGTSILGELEEQYHKLVVRYETLIKSKNVRSPVKDMATQFNCDGAAVGKRPTELPVAAGNIPPRKPVLDLRSPLDGHFENGPPEYKKLFKEIFETLRSSVVYEDEQASKSST